MRLRSHLRIGLATSLAWLLFWLAGLPGYYRQYSTGAMIVFDLAVLPPLVWFAFSFARKPRRSRPLAMSLWLAFYVTVPLFLFDWIYCGWYLGHGLEFLALYWYLTAYYVIPWMVFPLAGWWVERQRARAAAREESP